ncbi:hypothetical protein ACMBCN_00355 [Candidatus Liberibacter asiaticus]|nr:hypothetical protein [Candidatus Liberibacter asiaticus]
MGDCQKWWLPLLSKKAATDSCKEEEEKWNKLAPAGREENRRCNEVIAYLITQIVASFSSINRGRNSSRKSSQSKHSKLKEESFQRVSETLCFSLRRVRKRERKKKREKRERKERKKKKKYLFGCIGFFGICELSIVF